MSNEVKSNLAKTDVLEKSIALTCVKGLWTVEFWNNEGELPVTVFDMKRIKRTLFQGHKMYLRTYNLDQRRRMRENEEQRLAKVELATEQAETSAQASVST